MCRRATSLDVFLDGHSFLIGGYRYSDNVMELVTQRRDNIWGDITDLTCGNATKIYNNLTRTLSYAKIESELEHIINTEVVWQNLHPVATKHPVANDCIK